MTSRRPLRVALTGGIATGKSYCLARFAGMGVPVIDADRLAHEAVEPGRPAFDRVVARFGREILLATGRLDRAALGQKVFADAAARHDLEQIVHPVVYAGISDWFSKLTTAAAFAIADVPLLYETGRDRDFDTVIVTRCRPEQQMERLMARGGLTEREARERIASQMPMADKARRTSYVIDTSGDFAATDRQIEEVSRQLSALMPGRLPQ